VNPIAKKLIILKILLDYQFAMWYKIMKVEQAANLFYLLTIYPSIKEMSAMAESILTKTCSKCNIVKSEDDFNKRSAAEDGLCPRCRGCCKEYYQSHKKEILDQKRQYYSDNKDEVLVKAKQYYENNKEEKRTYAKRYHKKNANKIKAYLKQYYADNNEEAKSKAKQYYRDNAEEKKAYAKQYREDNKAYFTEYNRIYSKSPNGKAADKKKRHQRRAQKMGAHCDNFNPDEVFERDGYRCQLCGKKTRPDYNRFHPLFPNLDHIVPLSKGGNHTKRNTQCLCHQCNSTKYNTGVGNQFRLFG